MQVTSGAWQDGLAYKGPPLPKRLNQLGPKAEVRGARTSQDHFRIIGSKVGRAKIGSSSEAQNR